MGKKKGLVQEKIVVWKSGTSMEIKFDIQSISNSDSPHLKEIVTASTTEIWKLFMDGETSF